MKKQQQEEVDLLGIKLLSTNCLLININLGTKIAINPYSVSILIPNGMCARQMDYGVVGLLLLKDKFAGKLSK